MATTMTLINSNTVGSGGTSAVVFSSIPSTYEHLYLVASARVTNSGETRALALRFNNDTGSNYTYKRLYGFGTGSVGVDDLNETRLLIGYTNSAGQTANTFGYNTALIINYANTSRQKTLMGDGAMVQNSTTQTHSITGGRWSGTDAINRIDILAWDQPADIAQHSTFYLYGITKQ
jgi:hypothetical protein